MKKILVIILGLVLLVSCVSQGNYPVSNEPVEITNINRDRQLFGKVIEFKYKGHEYIWFQYNYGYADGHDGGIVHNPDCKHPSHKKNTENGEYEF